MVTSILFEEVAGKTKLTAHFRATSHRRTRQAVQMGFAETVVAGQRKLATYLRYAVTPATAPDAVCNQKEKAP